MHAPITVSDHRPNLLGSPAPCFISRTSICQYAGCLLEQRNGDGRCVGRNAEPRRFKRLGAPARLCLLTLPGALQAFEDELEAELELVAVRVTRLEHVFLRELAQVWI